MFGWLSKAPAPPPAPTGDPVGCFGKMSLHADFIRHNLRLREAVNLESWIQEGVSHLARRPDGAWGELCRAFPGCHFILAGGDQDRTLAGQLIGSRDRSGRHYPFVIFTAADEPLFRQMQAVPPFFYEEFFRSADELCRENWVSEPVGLLTGRVEGLFRRQRPLARRPLLEEQIEKLRAYPVHDFWEGVLPAAGAEDRERLFLSLFEALRAVARRSCSRTPWGIRLPLPSSAPRPVVVFWVQLIESALEDRNLRCHYFWSPAAGSRWGSLSLFFRSPPASYLQALFDPERDDGALFDVVREMRQVVSPGQAQGELRQMLNDPQMNLLEILYRAGRRERLA